ncbi:MAG: alpha-L-glutamate ligase-like protein [Deltaproteobacteria bacterium]|nr:alpha-L-glutamate ligase-like protein [Deltaproteobacteria bacterium]
MWNLARQLAALGVLGINRRNADFTLAHNPRRLYPLVDNKLQTKSIAAQAGIPIPELYGVIETEYQVRHLPELLSKHPDFVIKPARGSGGDGILVIAGRAHDRYRTVSGYTITQDELAHQVFDILSGLYSLGGLSDQAMIEYRVQFDPIFEPITYHGAPDIRIIVYLGVPVMAMLRLPTRASNGKANLHQGALGVGLDLATGATLATAVCRQEILMEHPDTGDSLDGLEIPHWEDLLRLAARCYEVSGLGYLGVDIVLDRFKGPLLLELNARPGLAIQIANGAGLLPRVRLVDECHQALDGVEARLAFAREHFAVSS